MVDSFGSSPRWRGLQDRQQQRRDNAELDGAGSFHQRRPRGSYIARPAEADFLLASMSQSQQEAAGLGDPSTPQPPTADVARASGSGRHSPYSGSFNGKAALASMIDVSLRRGSSSVVDVRDQAERIQTFLNELPKLDHDSTNDPSSSDHVNGGGGGTYGSFGNNGNNNDDDGADSENLFQSLKKTDDSASCKRTQSSGQQPAPLLTQIPAIAIAALLNLMMAIPFGVSYFPIGWSATGEAPADDKGSDVDGVSGVFPLPGKEALGIRMCLFSTLVGQLVMTFASKFEAAIAYQMIENVPFFHTLASIVIAYQGYGIESLSTLFFLFGLSSALVGILFYLLGRLDLGRVVYFFPQHVLIGCIGGIGVFIIISALEVTNDTSFSWNLEGLQGIIENFHKLAVVLLFEATLRLLIWKTKSRIPLLSPIFFCSIPFVFYAVLFLFRVDMDDAMEAGFFFPAPKDEDANQSLFDRAFSSHTLDLLKVVNFSTINWEAVYNSFGTMVALAAFSLIHVPINIPAFSISMDIETDMNAELQAHGYSNFVSGMFGGLPNYMTYSNSLLFAKSKGGGMVSSLLVSFFTFIFFLFGPELAIYIPRCMAGTLLLHIGLDLFIEGVVDSYYFGYDRLEYGGIWLITITMTALGMTAGLCAGVLAALSVYAAQSITYINPIRAQMPATTLLSSVWTRPASELAILNDERTGRSRVLVVQLQGHLFFGNANQLTETITSQLADSQGTGREPLIIILDFTLVLGLDSSASHAVAKMNTRMHRRFNIAATVFVAGRDGFPCEFALSEALSRQGDEEHLEELEDLAHSDTDIKSPKYRRNRICDNLDDALIFAEDVLVLRQDPSLLRRDREIVEPTGFLPPEDERKLAVQQLANLFPKSDEITSAVKLLFSFFEREEYTVNQKLWKQGDDSTCAKLLVRGELLAYSDSSAHTSMVAERVPTGNIVGELGLVQGLPRLSTLECTSEKAILYSLSLESWKTIRKEHSFAAVYFEEIVIRYLANRAQHVTRIFDSRCLPV